MEYQRLIKDFNPGRICIPPILRFQFYGSEECQNSTIVLNNAVIAAVEQNRTSSSWLDFEFIGFGFWNTEFSVLLI